MLQRTFLLLIALSFALAGCADSAPVVDEDAEKFNDFELEATEETGVIRGVVVDETITPIEGVEVKVEGTEKSLVTGADGVFGFKDLAPGFYNINVDGVGYKAQRTQTNVEAGVADPPIIRVLLVAEASELPSVLPNTFNGYLDCSISSPAYRVAACGIANPGGIFKDNFLAEIFDLDANATWIQAEMVWESTQQAGSRMMFTVEDSASDGGNITGDPAGESPLLAVANTDQIRASPYKGYIMHRVFNYEIPETTPPVPVCGIPNPIHGGTMCAKGVGATLFQPFDIYTHVFSNGKPQDGWRFSSGEEVQVQPL